VECGYDLRQIDSERCPECGAVIDRSVSGQSIIPWRQRARIGRFRGFWATVWMVTARPQRLALETNRPADIVDALKFRRIVIILAMLAMVPATAVALGAIIKGYTRLPIFDFRSHPLDSALYVMSFAYLFTADWFFLLAMTGVASYFFHPRSLTVEQQNRAIALSYYACAPLAMVPIVALTSIFIAAVFSSLFSFRTPLWMQATMAALIFAPPGLVAVAIWHTPLRVLRAVTRCGIEQRAVLGSALPIVWAALAGLLFGAIPVAVLLVVLMFISLR
jgi:hypothetical protein